MGELGTGERVFDHAPVRGQCRVLEGPSDILDLMDSGAEGVVALVRDAGATFLAPIFHELAGVICTGGTPRSHVGIVCREFQVPCLMGFTFRDGVDAATIDGSPVEVDCSSERGVLRD